MRKYCTLFILLTGILFGACRKNEEPAGPSIAIDTTAIIGSWVRQLPDHTVFEVLFHSDKTYEFSRYEPNGQPFVLEKGCYSNTECSYTLKESNNTACLGYNAIYLYNIIGNKITFTPQSEFCDERAAFLIGEWKNNK